MTLQCKILSHTASGMSRSITSAYADNFVYFC